jgi:hypothetical protein
MAGNSESYPNEPAVVACFHPESPISDSIDNCTGHCIAVLRAAFRVAGQERPFTIDAIVILPDHLHAILTLPQGDADFAGRWRRIKGHFSTRLLAVLH